MAQALKLNTKPKLERFARAQLAEGAPVVQADAKPGIIKGVSVITKGEALGHGMWIDDQMLNQVQASLAAQEKGVKSRFTHPGMSSDGLGRHLGRVVNGQLTGKSVVGDLRFARSAYSTPDGNLAQYVTDLVNEDPEAAGLSIAFQRDFSAEVEFALANGAVMVDTDEGPMVDLSSFASPDPDNVNNLPHCRLAELRAVDVVDEPAANPNGMFDSNPIARNADIALAYMLGLSTDKPAESLFGVNVDRASQFVTRFLSNRKLKIVEIESPKDSGTEQPLGGAGKDAALSQGSEPTVTREDFAAELAKYTTRFGAVKGVEWFTAKKTLQEALELHVEELSKERDSLTAQVAALNERLSQVSVGTEPLNVAGLSSEKKPATTISEAKALAAKSK